MYRKIQDFLKTWKESAYRKPLILQGARQVGKTYSILEFGRRFYENVAYFNFETNPKLNETFCESISPDYLIPILSHIAGQTIVKEKTLIVFDEIQRRVVLVTNGKADNGRGNFHIGCDLPYACGVAGCGQLLHPAGQRASPCGLGLFAISHSSSLPRRSPVTITSSRFGS